MEPVIIKTATGTEYLQREFIDAWGRHRVCTKRVADLPKPHATACACCGQAIRPQRSTMRFCSAGCRVKWNRANRSTQN